MSPQPLKLAIPAPCRQRWEDLQPASNGRHCAHRNQEVVDFTRMTDAALLDYVHRNGLGCGRFRADQLDRELRHLHIARLPWWKRAAVAAGLIVATQKAGAQADRSIGLRYEHLDIQTPEIAPQPDGQEIPASYQEPAAIHSIGRDIEFMGYVVQPENPFLLRESRLVQSGSMGVLAMLKNRGLLPGSRKRKKPARLSRFYDKRNAPLL